MHGLTGSATDKLVPSRATIKVITASVMKATYSLREGLNSSAALVSTLGASCMEESDDCRGSVFWSMTAGEGCPSLSSDFEFMLAILDGTFSRL